MAKEQSKKNKYPSLYSPGGWVREDQYIIELICEKKAKLDKKDLPVQFWKQKEWEKFFKSQLRICQKLLKKYPAKAIISALKDKRSWSIYSLYAPWFEDIVKSHDNKQISVKEEKPQMTQGSFRRNSKLSKNIIDLLEENT